eukprot:1189959-Ditylum_brightwellii.AAC.1
MDFTRKTRWILDGQKTPDLVRSTYAGVVSRESVRIAFTYAALNNLDVWTTVKINVGINIQWHVDGTPCATLNTK